jgi:2-polyprenyl-3-methyl-5-hydroxy-6-metoxy-1,4-benzoquinol methylase
MDIYDPFYAPNNEVFDKQYNFITSTEVIEHMHQPLFELKRLKSMLKPNGVLGIMTMFHLENKEKFAKWFYKNDPTHITFFCEKSFIWLAKELNLKLTLVEKDVILLQKFNEGIM